MTRLLAAAILLFATVASAAPPVHHVVNASYEVDVPEGWIAGDEGSVAPTWREPVKSGDSATLTVALTKNPLPRDEAIAKFRRDLEDGGLKVTGGFDDRGAAGPFHRWEGTVPGPKGDFAFAASLHLHGGIAGAVSFVAPRARADALAPLGLAVMRSFRFKSDTYEATLATGTTREFSTFIIAPPAGWTVFEEKGVVSVVSPDQTATATVSRAAPGAKPADYLSASGEVELGRESVKAYTGTHSVDGKALMVLWAVRGPHEISFSAAPDAFARAQADVFAMFRSFAPK